MSKETFFTELLGTDVDQLREDLRADPSETMNRRRSIIRLSLVGMASMGAISLLQTGIVDDLPDLPLPNFDAIEVTTSDAGYQFGVPDAALSFASLAANIPLAALGDADRARKRPAVPLLSAGKAALEAVGAAGYFYQMAAKEDGWCGYCIAGALVNVGLFVLTLPEAREALAALRGPS